MKRMMKKYKTIYLDIMVNGRFYQQLAYRYCPFFVIDFVDVKKFILKSLPSLKNKDWKVGFSSQRVGN